MGPGLIILLVFIIVILLLLGAWIVSRYKKCPSDKIMVIYGKVKSQNGEARSAKCIHGGAQFIVPFFQSYEFMDLTPMSIQVDLKNALSKQNIRIDVPSRFTVGISTEAGVMQNAAERLLGLKLVDIQELAKDIIFGQLRLVIATMDIEEINTDRDKFLEAVSRNVETELKKIGLRLINVNVTDITDESGYIDALGKEAAAKAINDAKRLVAEQNREGSIGEANADRDMRVRVAEANSVAIQGENESKAAILRSNADLMEIEAESTRRATAAQKIAEAKALQDAYNAQMNAEIARAEKEKATLKADVIVKQETEKERIEIEAEAKAEEIRRVARGEADAIYAKMEAEARGIQETLTKQAEGYLKIVEATSGKASDAAMLMIADKIENLVSIQVEAIKNIKFDKITVWDGGSNNGSSSTANFAQSIMKAIPPLNEIFKSVGLEVPSYLAKPAKEEKEEIIEEK